MRKTERKQLLDSAPDFDSWFATWIATNDFADAPEHVRKGLYDIAKDANIRGYVKGTHNTIKIYEKWMK